MLEGKVVLVSGGTGAIGSAACLAAARYGADVGFSFHRNEAKAAALQASIEGLGRRCVAGGAAATDGAAIRALCARVEAELGPVDVLVNNLGAAQVMPFALIDEEDWDDALAVNLKGLFLFTKAVVRGMIRRRAGVVVNIGSVGGHRMVEVPVHYATAKAAVTGFTLSLAKELSRYGIRVNEVRPGLIDGGVGANASERQRADYEGFCALRRVGTPDEVAEAIAFVASDRASYVNGQAIVVDGGL